jgi:predicted DNA-binding protein (MmcQ/YjbR family)
MIFGDVPCVDRYLDNANRDRHSAGVTNADDRALARIRRICLGFPEVEEAELQERPLFRVRTRRFALFNGARSPQRPRWSAFGRSLHFLSEPEERLALLADERFTPSPHHGDRGWIALDLEIQPDWAEVAELLEAGYRQAANRQLNDVLNHHQERGNRAP